MISELLVKVGMVVIDLFIQNKKNKEAARKRLIEAAVNWDSRVLDSARLRESYEDLLEQAMKDRIEKELDKKRKNGLT